MSSSRTEIECQRFRRENSRMKRSSFPRDDDCFEFFPCPYFWNWLLACWQGYLMTTCLGKWSLLSVYVYMYLCVYEVMCEEVNMSSALLRIVIVCPLWCTVLTAYMVMLEVLSCSPHVSAICKRYLIPGEHTSNSTVEGGRMMSIRPISCYFLFHFNDKSQAAGWYRMCPFPIQSNNLNLMHMRC